MIKTFTNENINDAHAYVVVNKDVNAAVLIDTAAVASDIVDYLKDNKIDLQDVILTHGHYDHVLDLDVIMSAFPLVKVWIDKKDLKHLYNPYKNFSFKTGKKWKLDYTANIKTFTKDMSVKMAEMNINLKPNPGHTAGSIFVEVVKEKAVFIGDTLFIKDDNQIYGRHHWYQMQTNPFAFKKTIKNLFEHYSDNWKIYPGHWDTGFKLETIKDDKIAK